VAVTPFQIAPLQPTLKMMLWYPAVTTMPQAQVNKPISTMDDSKVTSIEGSNKEPQDVTLIKVTGNANKCRHRAKCTTKAKAKTECATETAAKAVKRQCQKAAKAVSQAKRDAKCDAFEALRIQHAEAAKAKQIAKRETTDHSHNTRSHHVQAFQANRWHHCQVTKQHKLDQPHPNSANS
jgi:hypothetical protein